MVCRRVPSTRKPSRRRKARKFNRSQLICRVSETKADGKVVSSTFARGSGRRNLGRWGLRCARADGAVIPPAFYQPPFFHRNTSGPCGMSRNAVRMVIVSPTTEDGTITF